MENKKVHELVVNTVIADVEKMGYSEGDRPALVLEETIKSLTGLSSIEELWGPIWVLFLVVASDKVGLFTDDAVRIESIKEVVSRMTGHSFITPYDSISEAAGVPTSIVSMTDERDNVLLTKYVRTATSISVDINIPSPIELGYLYSVLGKDVSPKTINHLWDKHPEKYKIDYNSKEDVVRMINITSNHMQDLNRLEATTH